MVVKEDPIPEVAQKLLMTIDIVYNPVQCSGQNAFFGQGHQSHQELVMTLDKLALFQLLNSPLQTGPFCGEDE